ncbi:MAG: CDP-alcohol phosphatidyltransferase family protein [bacterium]|nr:CDP-alcohol phosphatidyltransferase family protein [bacterium]
MQKLDRATLLELEWRDFFFWPLVRPAGILFHFASAPLSRIISAMLKLLVSPFDRHRTYTRFLQARAIQDEVLTCANIVTLYGLFLWVQLVYAIWAWFSGFDHVRIYAVSAYFFDLSRPTILAMAILVIEIFVSDLIDGPLARVNNEVTALGTILDHTRDYITAFTALFFLLAITIASRDIAVLILECAAIGSFMCVMAYHAKLMRLYTHSRALHSHTLRKKVTSTLEAIEEFALEEYQTKLTGRIQFGAMAISIVLGLFHYGIDSQVLFILFLVALVCSIMATSYYLYELWGEHYEKWQKLMQEKSQELKEKLIDKIKR